MDAKKNRYNPYGTDQDELPYQSIVSREVAVSAVSPASAPEERFDAERIQKISTGAQLETLAGLIIQNHNSRLEISEYNWFGYNSKTLLVGEKSTINFSLGAQGMSEFSFDYFALHNHSTMMNFYDASGNLIGSEKLLYTGSVTAKQFVIKTLSFTAPPGTQIARAELVTGDEPAVGDYGFHIDNVKWTPSSVLQVNFTFDQMQKDTGASATDFITKDGSAGRQVEGTLSRTLVTNETLEFWDGSKWVTASVNGMRWQAQDNIAHNASWEYKLRVVDAAGNITQEQSHQVVLDVTPSQIQVIFDRMSKDDGIVDDWRTTDGSAGRIVSGSLSTAMSTGDVAEYSLDGGITWHLLTLNGTDWSFTDKGSHISDWQYQVRITDVAGNISSPVVQDVVLLPPPVRLSFDRMDKDTGTSATDFITKDGSAGRLVEGNLSRLLEPGEKLQFWNGTEWVEAITNGLRWHAQDDTAHGSSWIYKVRVIDASGSTLEDRHQDVVLTPSLPIQATFERMEKDSGSSDKDFITRDGSAGRLVQGTLSRTLEPDETLEFWDGTQWSTASVKGLVWQAQDTGVHGDSWQYKLRVTDVAGTTLHEKTQNVTLDVTPSDVQVIFERMSKDDGVADDWKTTDGSAGRTVSGSLSKALSSGDVAEYSLDGGKTWQVLSVATDNSWSFTDGSAHAENWQYQLRITDIAGNATAPTTQDVALLTSAISLSFTRMDKDTGSHDTDFITKDGSAGRLVEGTLSRALYPGETLKFWDTTKWVTAVVDGLKWQAQDNSAHASSWQYKLRVTDNTGSTLQDHLQNVVLDVTPSDVNILFERMDKDDGIADDWKTTDGSAGRTVSGSLSKALSTGDGLEYSTDGGTSWQKLAVSGLNWSFIDVAAHVASWEYQVRIIDIAGNISVPAVQEVELVQPNPITLTFTRMEKDTGASDTDFVTSDLSAGRLIEGTLSRALEQGEKLEFWDGTKWVNAVVTGLSWQAQDNTAHTDSWTYTLRVVDQAGKSLHEQSQDVVHELIIPDAAKLAGMGKDSGMDIENLYTNDGRAGRIFWGTFDATVAGTRVEVTIDGGLSWHDTLIDGNKWVWQDQSVHTADWTLQTRITDVAGNIVEGDIHQIRMDVAPPNAPELIDREGNKLTVSLKNSNVVAGDKVIVHLDGKNAFYTLTSADIQAGQAIVTLPSGIRLSTEYRAAFMDAHGNVSNYFSRTPFTIDFEDHQDLSGPRANRVYDFGRYNLRWAGPDTTFDGIFRWASAQGPVWGDKGLGLVFTNSATLELNNDFRTNKVIFDARAMKERDIRVDFYDGGTVVHSLQIYKSNGIYQHVEVTLPAGKTFTAMKFSGLGRGTPAVVDNLIFELNNDKLLPTETVQTVINGDLISVGDNLDNTFIVNKVSDLSKIEMLNGNGGIDTLKLNGANETLDLTAFLGKIQSMEVIDITGSGNNTLNLSLGDILQQGGKDLLNMSGNVQMVVKGNAGDKVNLSDLLPDNGDVGDWSSSGNVTVGGVVYTVWQHSALDAELLVQSGVTTNLINH
ncbi:hypothetical protein GJV14_24700 [Enterobacteriaceae bacterium RIT697]|jgi:hypothetical protein|uniref:hypothetical protein n=1 Tax=Pantoea sp. YR343 TaxID=1144341 RepID=UPI0012AE3FC1|nr:hypothetical protein [Pantoea sp. YR343]KAJ9434107.1 hypothetical protein PMI39_017860 [Pantoea sp. YR343]MRT27168.1 hypothetical protein [Enterobacteriaceae bacterium RIT697]